MKNILLMGLVGLVNLVAAEPVNPKSPLIQLEQGIKKSHVEVVKKIINNERLSLFKDYTLQDAAKIKSYYQRLAKQRLVIHQKKLICNFTVLTKYGYYGLLLSLLGALPVGLVFINKLFNNYKALSLQAANGGNVFQYNIAKSNLGLGILGELLAISLIFPLIKEIKNWRSVEDKIIEAKEIKHMLKKF